jgi:hypothetical protein
MSATKDEFLHTLLAITKAQDQALRAQDMDTLLALYAEAERLFERLPDSDLAPANDQLRAQVLAAQEKITEGLAAWRSRLVKSGRKAHLAGSYGKSG